MEEERREGVRGGGPKVPVHWQELERNSVGSFGWQAEMPDHFVTPGFPNHTAIAVNSRLKLRLQRPSLSEKREMKSKSRESRSRREDKETERFTYVSHPPQRPRPVSYTHLTLPTNREV